jgi:nucleoside recognition membrane protein YjiH
MSAAPVGVQITIQQFEKGNYSMRESAVIATNFSVVSVPFCVIVIQTAGLEHLFVEYYLTVVVTGLVAAIITPRIPPLSRIPDHYSEKGRQLFEDSNPQEGLWSNGFNAALQKSQEAPGLRQLLKNAIRNLFDIWFGLLPSLVAIGTIGLVLAEFTPLLRWLSLPLIPLLNLFQLPEANLAAPALLAGFADMFLPAVLVKNISSEITRFVVATVSITQLIYMTEIGVLILRSRIPLNILNLIQIFLIRMLISLPIVIISARLFVF